MPTSTKRVRIGVWLLAILSVINGTMLAGARPDGIRPGVVIESVPCQQFAGQSYALYLPAGYTSQKAWPIVYAFDPGAQGEVPVTRYREIAEKYGYILAASNNSQNFVNDSTAIEAMLADTQERFSVDPNRVYTTGFSGGARVATLVALRCRCKVAGVVTSGATYPGNIAPSANDSFPYFMALGNTDFNYPEVVQTRLVKERFGSPYHLRMFPGPHQWAPASVFEQAIVWFELRAMRSGTISKVEAFIAEHRKQTAAEALDAEEHHEALRAYFAYKSLVEDFPESESTADAKTKLQSLKASSELKKALDKERRDVEMQQRLEEDANASIVRFFANPFDSELRSLLLTDMQMLRRNGQRSKEESEARIYLRAQNALFARLVEEGQRRKIARKFNEALSFFELLSEAAPERAWPPLLVAETRAAMGDHKRALKALRQATHTGHITAEMLQKDQDLAPLFRDPEFQQLAEELRKRPTASP